MSARIPPELIQQVAQYSQLGEQAVLIRASRSCWTAVGPYLWNEVHCDEKTLRLLVDAALCSANGPVTRCTYSASDVEVPRCQEQLDRLRLIVGWIRVLHVYPNQYTSYRWPPSIFEKIQIATGGLPPIPRLHKVFMHRYGLRRPSRSAFYLAQFFLHPGLRSLEFVTTGQSSGLDLTHCYARRLCRILKKLEVPLERLALRCPDHEYFSVSQYAEVTHIVRQIGRLHTLTHISVTGSLLNATALSSLGSMPLLNSLQVIGGLLEVVNDDQLDDASFPSLRCLDLRYLDDDQTSAICSISRVMRSLHDLTIEWDTDTEPGFPGIDETVSAIAKLGTSIRRLHLKLHGVVTARRTHCIPACVWQNPRSEGMESVTLLGFSLAACPCPTLQCAIEAIWPHLKTLNVPMQGFTSEEPQELKLWRPQAGKNPIR